MRAETERDEERRTIGKRRRKWARDACSGGWRLKPRTPGSPEIRLEKSPAVGLAVCSGTRLANCTRTWLGVGYRSARNQGATSSFESELEERETFSRSARLVVSLKVRIIASACRMKVKNLRTSRP